MARGQQHFGLARLALFLRQYRTHKEGEPLLLARPLTVDDLAFSNVDGKPLDPGTQTLKFAKIARKAGLPGTRFHDLRHTFASPILLGGVNPRTVSEALGHPSPASTLQVYSHLLPGIQTAAMARQDEVLESAA
jgi:integrase